MNKYNEKYNLPSWHPHGLLFKQTREKKTSVIQAELRKPIIEKISYASQKEISMKLCYSNYDRKKYPMLLCTKKTQFSPS